MKEIRSQAEADAAIAAGEAELHIYADVAITITSGNPRIEAWGSSAPRIEAWESSAPRIVAWESSAPRIVAWESSAPRIEAWESSAPRIEARGSSAPMIVAWGSSAPRIVARGSSAPRIVAWESSAPRIEAWGSSAPRIEARGSSAPRIEARGSSAPRIVAWGSSAPRIVAWAYAMLAVEGSGVTVHATAEVRIRIDGGDPQIDGGVVHRVIPPRTPAEWCEAYGADVKDGVAVLYKAVSDDFKSGRGFDYTPWTVPFAPDWDGMARECGGGLHFCSTPCAARGYFPSATRYVGCPVALADIVVHEHPRYPDKVKARGCCGPVWECDEDGNRVDANDYAQRSES